MTWHPASAPPPALEGQPYSRLVVVWAKASHGGAWDLARCWYDFRGHPAWGGEFRPTHWRDLGKDPEGGEAR